MFVECLLWSVLAFYYKYWMLSHFGTVKDAGKALVKKSSKLTVRGRG